MLVVHESADDAKDLLKWKISRGAQTSTADMKDPAGGGPTLRVCLYDASASAQPLLESTVLAGGTCGGTACWKPLGAAGGYRYKNNAGTPDGITDLKLRVGGDGELRLLVKGKGANLLLPPLGFSTPVTLALVVEDATGTSCWRATFAAALRNDATVFKAVSP